MAEEKSAQILETQIEILLQSFAPFITAKKGNPLQWPHKLNQNGEFGPFLKPRFSTVCREIVAHKFIELWAAILEAFTRRAEKYSAVSTFLNCQAAFLINSWMKKFFSQRIQKFMVLADEL